MNIFYLSSNAKECAQFHVDKHVVKMIVELQQILSTTHRLLDGKETIGLSKSGRKQKIWTLPDERQDHIYKATHINHPSCKWARNSSANYQWLFQLMCELLAEYTYRYGKKHASERLVPYLSQLPKNIPIGDFEQPWRAMPDEFKVAKTNPDYCVESYRAYYKGAKRHIFAWKNRSVPYWVN